MAIIERIAPLATVLRIIDSDTLEIMIDIGWGLTLRERLRLKGIEGGESGTSANMNAVKWLDGEIFVNRRLTGKLLAHHELRDQFGRLVGDLEFWDKVRLVDLCLNSGFYWLRSRSGKTGRDAPGRTGEAINTQLII